MRALIYVLLATVFIIACSTTQPVSMHPDLAKIPELEFYYQKNGNWVRVRGHGASYFQAGEAKRFLVKSNTHGGDCIINYQDGDTQNTYACDSSGETLLDLGKYYVNHPPVIGISVAMKDLGNQVGYLYANLGSQRTTLAVDFKCPYQDTNSNLSVCSRPANYPFVMTAHVPANGQIQFVYQCNGEALQSQVSTVTGPANYTFQMTESAANYCNIALNFKSDTMQAQQVINVRFYDNSYIPLSLPVVTKVSGGYQVCAGEDYEAYTLNNEDHGSLGKGRCETVQGAILDFVAWDSIGRVTWAYQTGSMAEAVMGYSRKITKVKVNNFKFYDEARPWFEKRIEHCGTDLACIQKEKKIALRDKKAIKAATNWNSKYFYN